MLFIFLSMLLAGVQSTSTTIQGVVVRAGTNDPVGKANVELRTDGSNAVSLDSMMTESDGRFAFPNLRPGRYQIVTVRAGYIRGPMAVTVTAGQPAPEVRLPMTPTGAIEGRVYSDNGEPFGNIEVQALRASYQEGRRALTIVQTAQTNDLGEYRLFWLAPGRYYIAVVHPEAQGMLRRMTMGSGSFSTMLGAGPGRFLAINSVGDPALEVYRDAEALDSQTPRYVPVYFPGTPDQQSATAVDLRAGTDFGGVNLVVAPVRARNVRGFVVDGTTGKPGQNAQVRLFGQGQLMNGPNEIKIDPNNGSFEIPLLPGSHTLFGTSGVGSGYASIQVRDADLENVTILTTPPFDITGRIAIEGGGKNSDLEELRLSLRRNLPASGLSPGSYSHPLPNGSFTLDAGAGDYRVNVAPLLNWGSERQAQPPDQTVPRSLEDAYVKSIRLANADVLNRGLQLERPPEAPLEIVIGMNPGALEGNVVSQQALPAPDVAVVLVPDIRGRTDLFKTATSDPSGRFRFDRLPPGDYKIFAWQEVENGAWFDPDFLLEYEDLGQAVRISEGSIGKTRSVAIPGKNF